MRTMRNSLLAIVVAVIIAGCGFLFLPYGETTVRATATITFDGEEYASSSIWRVSAQTQNGWPDSGINYRQMALGDAIEFEIASDLHAFLRPGTYSVSQCARQEHREAKYLAEALPLFQGPCSGVTFAGFTFVTFSDEGTPTFTNFVVDGDELMNDGQGRELSPDIQAIADKRFALLSFTVAATSAPLPNGMVERHPWILDLPRTDACGGKPPREDVRCWSFGETYQQYFTTDLPDNVISSAK